MKKLIAAIIAIIVIVVLLFLFIPSLRSIFGGTSGEDERTQKIVDAARAEEDSVFHVFIDNDKARFYTPGNAADYFDSFFAMLDSAKSTPVRVTHYGDSQIEIDRISCILRETLQSRFGGGGIGYVPFKNVGTYTSTTSVSPVPSTTHAYGTPDMKGSGDNYGMAAMATHLGGGSVMLRVSTTKADAYKHSHDFSRFTVMGKGNFSISSNGKSASISSPSKASRASIDIPVTTDATVTVSGSGTLFGVLADGANGVSVDNIPMRGCSGTIFRTINAANLREHYSACNVGLIIMQYGGNVMPYIKEGQSLDNYVANLGKQIAYLHEIAPKAKILFIGPSDMSTRKGGSWATYPVLPQVVEGIKKVANENGAAFWDMFGVMGGKNSMIEWCANNLAGPDHIHFTRKGADKVAQELSDALMHYYDYYKWRTSPIDVQKYLHEDSIKNNLIAPPVKK